MCLSSVLTLSALVLCKPAENATVSQLWPIQKEFLAMPREARATNQQAIAGNKSIKRQYRTKTAAKPVDFAWTGDANGVYTFSVRRLPDRKVFYESTITGLAAQVVGRLEVGREWEWTVESNGKKATGRFRTEDRAPRILKFDGVSNARDIGGWRGLDGRRVRQGLVFRTGGLNANAKCEYYSYEEILELFRQGKLEGAGVGKNAERLAGEYARSLGQGNGIDRNFLRLMKCGPKKAGEERLTAADRAWFLGFAGVKSDIDFREDYETFGMLQSPLGPKVRWFHYPMYHGYHGIVTPLGRATMAQAFSVLCSDKNYPVVFHCIGGTDRTGTFAYLLGALLGVDEEDLVRDYEVSFISLGGTDKRHAGWISGLVMAVRNLPGETLADKAKRYFMSLGFEEEQVDAVRERLLEPAPSVAHARHEPSVEYAREEFSKYVRRMTGRDYDGKIEVILDGALGKEEFAVSQLDGKLTVRGGVRGVLYGVYDVLERFGGVRWYSSWCEKVPSAERFVVPEGTKYSEKPTFWMRLPYWTDILRHADFAARLRVNGHLSDPLSPRHGGAAYCLDKKFGFTHTFNRIIPPSEFKDTHPEYFSEIDGRRVTERTQLCLTNPDVYNLVLQRLKQAIAENPEADLYALTHNDYKNWCECAKCRAINDAAGNPGMTEFLFVNKVAAEIAKDHPNILIKLSAYVYTRKPPTNFKLHPNVVVELCPIEADLIFPLPDSKYEDSIAFCKDMDGWSKVSSGNFLVWDYNTAFLNLLQILPNAYTPKGNDLYYCSKGVNMIFNQGDYTGYHADFAELKAYLQAKWAWNPKLEAEPLVADFFEGYYGPAAPFIREYFDDIYARQRAFCADGSRFMTCYSPARSLAVDGDGAFFKRSTVLWERAKASVKGNAMFEYNVNTSALSFEYTSLCINARRFYITEHPENFGPETDAHRLATTCLKTIKDAERERGGTVRLMEDGVRHRLCREGLEEIARSGPADKSIKKSLTIAAKDFIRSKSFVLTNGWARFDCGKHDWVTALNLDNLAYDKGTRYGLRVHAKVERSANMPNGVAFKGGYYDPENNSAVFERAFTASEVSSDWGWYDIGETEFGPGARFWISAGTFDRKKHRKNPCINALLVDKVEILARGAISNGGI